MVDFKSGSGLAELENVNESRAASRRTDHNLWSRSESTGRSDGEVHHPCAIEVACGERGAEQVARAGGPVKAGIVGIEKPSSPCAGAGPRSLENEHRAGCNREQAGGNRFARRPDDQLGNL